MPKNRVIALSAAVGITAFGLLPASAGAAAASVTVGCHAGDYASISDAVNAVADGGSVTVCAGTYNEDVLVQKSVVLTGHNATVQPAADSGTFLSEMIGGNNGFTVLAPNVTVQGFTVQGATGDGIFVAGDHALVANNLTRNNGINGINLDGSSYSAVRGNTVSGNGGGIELANDPDAAGITLPGVSGAATYDVVENNRVVDNPQACAIYLVDHAGTPGSGIHDNLIKGNTVANNALHGYGAGILMASPMPNGAIYDNTILANTITNNGLSGVTIHAHVPGQNFNGNVIANNVIGTNNVMGFEADAPGTTGVFIGTQTPMSITLAHNTISDDKYGVVTAGKSVKLNGLPSNRFVRVTTPVFTSPTFEGS